MLSCCSVILQLFWCSTIPWYSNFSVSVLLFCQCFSVLSVFQCSVSVLLFRRCSGKGMEGRGGAEVKGQKRAQNNRKFFSISQELQIIWLWFLVHMCKMMLQQIFSFFKILIFGVFRGIKGKKDLKLLISVCFALYLRSCGSCHQDFDNDIYNMCLLFFLNATL